jgi:predicted transcriptional regulator of viral defense system
MNSYEKLKKIIDKGQPFTTAETQRLGIPRQTLTRMCRKGIIQRVARGIYTTPGNEIYEYSDMKMAVKLVPYGIICLFPALEFHNLTTQIPHQIWLAIPQGRRRKAIKYPEVQYISLVKTFYEYGIEEHNIDGVCIKVYSVAKTVADCFKFRNKIGLEVALEALREAKSEHKATNAQIIEAARACRVEKIIMPYLEALS